MLSLLLKLQDDNTFVITGICRNKTDESSTSKYGYVIVSPDKIINQFCYCAKSKCGLYIVHNHPYGTKPSGVDINTAIRLGHYAADMGLPALVLGIWDMQHYVLKEFYIHSN